MGNAHTLIYPIAVWEVAEEDPCGPFSPGAESIFALANGYLGLRGTPEERGPVHAAGSFINGFFETEPIVYGESAYGFAKNRQQIVTLPDLTVMDVLINEVPVDPRTGTVLAYRRRLDLRTGVLERMLDWQSPDGDVVRIRARRLVSFRRQHVAAVEWSCTVANQPARIRITSVLRLMTPVKTGNRDPRVGPALTRKALVTVRRDADERVGTIRLQTRNSGLEYVGGVANDIETASDVRRTPISESTEVGHAFDVSLDPDTPVRITKYVAAFTSRDHPRKRLMGLTRQEVEAARSASFRGLETEQAEYLGSFWERSDVQVEGDDALQQSIRFNLFHLLQAAGHTGGTSVAAKGLSGAGYEGHYFWDTETYVMPFFIYTNPGIARSLLEYRYSTLNRARERARVLRHRGALYPWRTINGDEASAYFPAGTAQYHINADIMYAVRKYVQATGDRGFLLERGAEMLFETARFWVDLGCYIDGKGFCINEVTGPDEYTALVNNNVYTNLMAADHLRYAVQVFEDMRGNDSATLTSLTERLGLEHDEVDAWRSAAEHMFVPFDADRGLYPQDDGFFDRAVWDFENTPPDRHPLLLHYHPLTIYRHQVLKQPDLVLALFLQGDRFTLEEKRDNFRYYDPITTGDSSLAPCIQCIVAAEIGETETAYNYFMKTARMDLDDVNGNVRDGVHTAAMAGTWLSMVYGFAGMRDGGGTLRFRPTIPRHWNRLQFRILWHGTQIEISIAPTATTYRLPAGGRIRLVHEDEDVNLSGTDRATLPNHKGS